MSSFDEMIRAWTLELQLVIVYRSGRKGFILESCPIYTNGDHHTGNLSHSSLTHPLVLVCFPIASPRQFYLSINHSIFPSGRSITTVESKLNCKADPFFFLTVWGASPAVPGLANGTKSVYTCVIGRWYSGDMFRGPISVQLSLLAEDEASEGPNEEHGPLQGRSRRSKRRHSVE